MSREVTEFDLRRPEFQDQKLKPENFEFDATGELVRKDRFEVGMRRVLRILIERQIMSPRDKWNVETVVSELKKLISSLENGFGLESQKDIASQSECVKNLVTQRNNESNKVQASLLLIDNFFDEQRQTPSSRQYANFIQEIYETLRGNDQTQESQACDHTMVEKTQFGDLERSFECIFCDHKTSEAWVTKHE